MRKFVLIIAPLLLIFSEITKAQFDNPVRNKKLKYGFNIGVNYSNLQVRQTNEDLQVVNATGVTLGIIIAYPFNEHWSISPEADIVFNNSKVYMPQPTENTLISDVYPSLIELSTHMLYKAKGEKIKPYVIFGPNFMIPVLDPKIISSQIAKSDLAIDIGIGADKMFSNFCFAPELRYSYGFINILNDNVIQKMKFNTVSLIFNFRVKQ